MIKAVALDFDGVILESADIKTEAFRELFAGHSDRLEEIVAYHVRHSGISRYRKFEFICSEILREPLTDSESRRLGEEFSRLVLEKVLHAPFVRGAEQFLREFSKRLPLYVVSGTPHAELRHIAEACGLSRYFREVFGSPDSKPDLLGRVMAEANVQGGDLLYVGDGISDLKSARAAGVAFVGRVPPGQPDPFRGEEGFSRVTDLADLMARWGELTGDGQRAAAC